MQFQPEHISDEYLPVNSPMCWDEEFWSQVTEDDWDDFWEERYLEAKGG